MTAAPNLPPPPLWSLPKPLRPSPLTPTRVLLGLTFCFLFDLGILLTSSLQLLLYPLALHPATRPFYRSHVLVFTKAAFGQLSVLITQWFAPTSFVVTAGEGMGEMQDWVERDERGQARGFKLPKRAVWMSNHQTLSDWLYVWSFAYFSTHSHHSAILITLKSSLRRIPFVGWACQLWNFIFLDRNWTEDQKPFAVQLQRVVKEVKEGEEPLALLIFPEGTIRTANTVPVSEKFASKIGFPQLNHTLLPRSTGIYFTLSSLARSLPQLFLLDLTIAYPGLTPPYYPEDYYGLLTWFDGVAPPSIHVHLRCWELKDVPLETQEEFEKWLRKRWMEKDKLIAGFVKTGSLAPPPPPGAITLNSPAPPPTSSTPALESKSITLPIRLRKWHEYLAAFSYFLPLILVWWGIVPVVASLWSILFGGGGGTMQERMEEGVEFGKVEGLMTKSEL